MPEISASRLRIITSFILFLSVFLIGCLASPRIGAAWDEPDNIYSGGVYWNFFRSGFNQSVFTVTDKSASIFGNDIFTQEASIARYPPVPNILGTALTVVSSRMGFVMTDAHIITMFHVTTAIFFAVMVVFSFKWGLLLGFSVPVAVLGAVVVWLYPTLFGHGYSNLKDTAQVSLFTVSLYYLVRAIWEDRKRDLFIGAVVWGLGLATKINLVYVPVIWLGWITFLEIGQWFRRGRSFREKVFRIKQYIPVLVIFPVGLATMVAVWPYLWSNTWERLQEVWFYFTSVGQGYRIFWDGQYYWVGTGTSLWWYPLQNLVLVTPLPLLFLSLLGLLVILGGVVHIRRSPGIHGVRFVVLLWMVIPVLRTLHPYAAFYDGIRHFMEILPPFLFLSMIGAEWLVRLVGGRFTGWGKHGRLVWGVIWLSLPLYLAYLNGAYFPYSTGYFNMLARNPNVLFDRDIEGLAVKEGVEYLRQKYSRMVLWVPVAGHLSWYDVTAADQYVYNDIDADSVVLINKRSHINHEEFRKVLHPSYRLVHTIVRGDAEFGWVYRKEK